jgi:hypothetical protein
MKKMSRRRLLHRGAGLAATSMTLPYLATGLRPGRAGAGPSRQLTMGAIGLGGQGMHNLKSFLTCEDLRVLAICDVDANHALQAKQTVDAAYGNQDCSVHNDF